MRITSALANISRMLIDTAPLIYFVQRHARYFDICQTIFDRVDGGAIEAVTTPITLAECLVIPYQSNSEDLKARFRSLIVDGEHTTFILLDAQMAERAARYRTTYNIELPDSFQIAAAVAAGCDAFLTNDARLKRVTDIDILVLDDLEAG